MQVTAILYHCACVLSNIRPRLTSQGVALEGLE